MADVASATHVGTRYGKLNQDWCGTLKVGTKAQTTWVGAVLDGHGLMGELAAQMCGESLLAYLKKNLDGCANDDIQRILKDAFLAAHESGLKVYDSMPEKYTYPEGASHAQEYVIAKHSGVYVAKDCCGDPQPVEFGATATVAVIRGRELWLAYVGDSVAVKGVEGSFGFQGEVVTPCHNGSNLAERDRISKYFSPYSEFTEDNYISVAMGEWEGTQLAVTRALSHNLMLTHGVVPEPDFSHHVLGDLDRILIVASDGVWDTVDSGEAVRLVADHAYAGPEAAAKELVEHAFRSAGSGTHDNTTAVVFLF